MVEFRRREHERELGNPCISPQRYVPEKQRIAATVAENEAATLRKPRYHLVSENERNKGAVMHPSVYDLRRAQPAGDVGPPFRFGPRTQDERIREEIRRHGVLHTDPAQFTPTRTQREQHKPQWKGHGEFHTSIRNREAFSPREYLPQPQYRDPPDLATYGMVSSNQLRGHRLPQLEKEQCFDSTTPADRKLPDPSKPKSRAPPSPKTYFKTLEHVLHSPASSAQVATMDSSLDMSVEFISGGLVSFRLFFVVLSS